MLDLIPFACPGRKVMDLDRDADFVGEALELVFPKAHARTIRTTAVGGDEKTARRGVTDAAGLLPPAADRRDGEGGRIVVNADIDPSLVSSKVIDAIGHGQTQFCNHVVVGPL